MANVTPGASASGTLPDLPDLTGLDPDLRARAEILARIERLEDALDDLREEARLFAEEVQANRLGERPPAALDCP